MRGGLGLAAAALCTVTVASLPARAQIASSPSPQGPSSGWSFAITPYIWLPTLSADLQATGPRGGTVSTSVSAGVGDYISDINFGLMLSAVARHDRFSVMTDLIYMNASLTTSVNHLSSVNLGPGPINIPRSQQLSTWLPIGRDRLVARRRLHAASRRVGESRRPRRNAYAGSR